MPIKVCPNCNQRYMVGFDSCDYVHKCNSGKAVLDNDDILITGNWEDSSGSGTKAPQAVLMQGAENELFGTRAYIEGEDKDELTARGNKEKLYRQRQHLEYIQEVK